MVAYSHMIHGNLTIAIRHSPLSWQALQRLERDFSNGFLAHAYSCQADVFDVQRNDLPEILSAVRWCHSRAASDFDRKTMDLLLAWLAL